MGCLSCKHAKIIENTNPHISKKESRWRFVVGLEAKGLEFNAQVGMVHSKYQILEIKPYKSLIILIIEILVFQQYNNETYKLCFINF